MIEFNNLIIYEIEKRKINLGILAKEVGINYHTLFRCMERNSWTKPQIDKFSKYFNKDLSMFVNTKIGEARDVNDRK